MTSTDLHAYYARQAPEFESTYRKPERQDDLARMRVLLQDLLAGHDVLELACGTGYWTQAIAATARSILATDVTGETLALARQKDYPPGVVRFQRADAFSLDGVAGDFTAAFAGFWWSHLHRSRVRPFLERLHARIGPGRLVVFIDNRYVHGSNHPVTSHDAEGNGYQRRLAAGQPFDVLKNFPDEATLRADLAGLAGAIDYQTLDYYWLLAYRSGQ